MKTYAAIERFLAKVDLSGPPDDCWMWRGSRNRNGYGRLRVDGRVVLAHRFIYEQFIGLIPDGFELDHLCRVHSCVNPAHVEPVTHAENVRRGEAGKVNGLRNASKTACPRGHPYAGDNLYVFPNGRRGCRACQREALRRYVERKARWPRPT